MDEKELKNEVVTDEEEKRKIIKGGRWLGILNIISVRVFMLVLFGFFAVSLIIPLRPSYSESEKRELASFPKFTFQALFSGDYFDGINEWYSDTFPFRESFMSLNARLSVLYGKTDTIIHGTVEDGDEIPDATQDDASQYTSSEVKSDDTQGSASSVPEETVSSEQSTASKPSQTTAQTMGALLINGDTAYEYYNFVKSTADEYSAAVKRAGELLSGKATVYDMIVPTSMGITAPEELTAGIKTSDQKKAIEYMYSGMQGVRKVSVFDTLSAHRNDYIYFRTDHHWTALGAYYAYGDFMKVKGIPSMPLDSFVKYEFPNYLGSFYTSSGKLPQLAANPDTVVAYQPPQTNSMDILFEDGVWKYSQAIISDMSNVSSKYLTFIKGDRPFGIINNPQAEGGQSCIVIKESFGNALVPFLVPHYKTVYVVDYRYFSKVDGRGLSQLVADTGAVDVLFINNISATRNKALVGYISSFVR